MYKHEKTYDIEELAKWNMHMHTTFSKCAKEGMDFENIIAHAEAANLEMIALTDHYNDDITIEEYLDNILGNRKKANECGSKIKILIGNELSGYGIGKTLESDDYRALLDYKLYSLNHYHLGFWEHPEDKSARGYAEHSLKNAESIIVSGKADCIAHPFIGRFIRSLEDRNDITRAIKDNELGDLFQLAVKHEVAFEINTGSVMQDPEFAKRMWNIGKETGLMFNMGTDAHTPAAIDVAQHIPRIKEILLS